MTSRRTLRTKSLFIGVALLIAIILLPDILQSTFAQDISEGDPLPTEKYGVNFTVYDTVATPTDQKGKYEATLDARLIMNANNITEIVGLYALISWNKERLSVPQVLEVPLNADDESDWVLPEEMEGDAEKGFVTSGRFLLWGDDDKWPGMIRGDNGTGYAGFKLKFSNITSTIPGEIIKNAVAFKEKWHSAGYSTLAVRPVDLADDPVDPVRETVTAGSIRIPGITVVYKSTDSAEAATFEQVLYTDEEVSAAKVLGNDTNQTTGNLTMPNFTVPTGKKLGGWSKTPNADSPMFHIGDPLSDIGGNVTLYPVWVPQAYTLTYTTANWEKEILKITGGTVPIDETKYSPGDEPVIQGDVGNLKAVWKRQNPGDTPWAKFVLSGWDRSPELWSMVEYPLAEIENGTVKYHTSGKSGGIKANGTLYARWAPAFDLKYDANWPESIVDEKKSGNPPEAQEYIRTGTSPSVAGNTGKLSVTDNSYVFLGWSRDRNATEAEYKEGAAYNSSGASGGITENGTIYAVWRRQTYTITYNANEGTVDGAGTKVVNVAVGDAYGTLPTPTRPGYNFTGWYEGLSGGVAVENTDKPTKNTVLYAHWEKDESRKCPYVLNIENCTLKDGQGNLIEENDNFSIRKTSYYDRITLKNPIFDTCTESHSHQLVVEGENPKVALSLSDIGTNVDVTLDWIRALCVTVSNAGTLNFEGANVIGSSESESMKQGLSGLLLENSIGNVVIKDSAQVILFNALNTVDGHSPYWNESTYTDIKLLDVIMNESTAEDTFLQVAGELVFLPAGASRFAILDNVDGTWLSGDIEILNQDGTARYVRGVAEDSNDTGYLDNRLSDGNLYGGTFTLSEGSKGRTRVYGIYDKVRLPQAVKQVKANFPADMIFNIYTKGSENEDFGFIGPVSKMNNESYTAEDSLTIGSVTKKYARVDSKLDIGFLGIMERADKPSGYILADYSKVTQEEMEQTVEKPKVCLEAVANGDDNNRIPIAQTNSLSTTPVKWFVADGGESHFQLVVPKAFQENPAGKRFYQMPSLLNGGAGEEKVSGHHYMRLAFALGDAQN